MCPLGAFALYLHYIHDVADVDTKYNIDYTVNKSWHAVSISVFLSHEILALMLVFFQIRLIHGSLATIPYNETALQNLFVQSYKKAGVESNLKAHLAHHMLGYHQERMGFVLYVSHPLTLMTMTLVYDPRRPPNLDGRMIPTRTPTHQHSQNWYCIHDRFSALRSLNICRQYWVLTVTKHMRLTVHHGSRLRYLHLSWS